MGKFDFDALGMGDQMAHDSKVASNWSSQQAYTLAVICLVLGGLAGYLLRGSSASDSPESTATAGSAIPGTNTQQPTPEQLAHMAEKQAEPLLQKLQSRPDDAQLLSSIGNVYYDARQYDKAIEYYKKSLKIQPANVDVRSDMATCLWYKNDADGAIAEFEKSLKYNPQHASTLYNLGVVKWQGKADPKGAVQAWEKLLQTNPNYENKVRVMELISRARQHALGGMSSPKG
jgi:cytochrome c-type biogenesis protein CcmH/NrfG